MKQHLTIFSFFILFLCTQLAQGWTEVSSPEIATTMNDLYMLNVNEGWMVGDGGYIYHTTDGFETFEIQASGVETDLAKIFFINASTGWIGTEGGEVLKTTDGGTNWVVYSFAQIFPEGFSFSYFNEIYFANATNGFAVTGKYGSIYLIKTVDGGATWEMQDSLKSGAWTDIKFYNENKGVIVGDLKSTQKYTIDGGLTWLPGDSTVMSAFSQSTVVYLSENDLVCVGEGSEWAMAPLPVFKSSDGGHTWTNLTDNTSNLYDRVKDIYFKDGTNGIGVGSNGFDKMFFYKTNDGGNTWAASTGSFACGLLAVEGFGDVLYALGTNAHLFKSEDFGETWNAIPLKSPTQVKSICFTENKGYALTLNSDIWVSEDGTGSSWKYLSACGMWDAGVLHFFDDNVGVAVKENRHMVKTTDGGLTWFTTQEPVASNTRNKVSGASFVGNTGYTLMSINDYAEYHVFKTTDAGDSWNEVSVFTGPGYLSGDITFFDENCGVIAAPRIKISGVYHFWLQYTKDGGTTWTDATINGVPADSVISNFSDAISVDENTGYATAGKYLFKTTDKGVTWQYVEIPGIESSISCISVKENVALLGLSDGNILVSEDNFTSWTKYEEFNDLYSYMSPTFNSAGNPFIATSKGFIVGNMTITDIEENNQTEIPCEYSLSQNYPNPFNPTTQIEFYVEKRGQVELAVFNILGQKVATLINTTLEAGKHEVKFDATNLTSGVYFYQLNSGAVELTRKMLLLK